MISLRFYHSLAAATAVVVLTSCGGGGGDPGPVVNPPVPKAYASSFLTDDGRIFVTRLQNGLASSEELDQGLFVGVNRAFARKVFERRLDVASGVVTNGEPDFVAYVANGELSRLDISAGAVSALSGKAQLCRVLGFAYDFQSPNSSFIGVDSPGGDGSCPASGSQNVFGFVLGRNDQIPTALTDCRGTFPIYASDGSLDALVCLAINEETLSLRRFSASLTESEDVPGFSVDYGGSIRRFIRVVALSPSRRVIGFNRLDENRDVYIEYDETQGQARTLITINNVDRNAESTSAIDDLVAGDADTLYFAAGNRIVSLDITGGGTPTEAISFGPSARIVNILESSNYLSVVVVDPAEETVSVQRLSPSGGFVPEELLSVDGTVNQVFDSSGDQLLLNLQRGNTRRAAIIDIASSATEVFDDAFWLGTVLRSASNLPNGLPTKLRKSDETGLLFGWEDEAHVLAVEESSIQSSVRSVRWNNGFVLSAPATLAGRLIDGVIEPFGSAVLFSGRQRLEVGGALTRAVYWLDTTTGTVTPVPTEDDTAPYLMFEQLQ